MKIKPLQQGVQHQALAQALQQSLAILQMPLLELRQLLEAELESNPVLEEASELLAESLKAPAEMATTSSESLDRLAHVTHPDNERTNFWETMEEDEDDNDPLSAIAQPPPTLDDLLLRQVHGMALSPEIMRAAELIIGGLDESGYFREPLETLAAQLHLPLAVVEQGLKAVQQCEPVGVGARSLPECLLLQLQAQGLVTSLAARLIQGGALEELGQRQYARLARRFDCTPAEIEEAARKIALLAPQPGAVTGSHDQPPSIVPDIVITKHGDDRFHVVLRDNELPPVRISPTYRRMLRDPEVTDEVRAFVRDRIQAAVAVLRGIQQRQQTMHRLAEAVVKTQSAFLGHGLSGLKPMTYKQMAEAIGRHPSTVARAVAHKYLECPAGVFALSELFSVSLPGEFGEEGVSSQSVRMQLRELVASEDRRHPLSDEAIVAQMREHGMHLARRTVAKYRQQLRIPAAHERRVRSA